MHKPIRCKLEKSPQGEWATPTVPPPSIHKGTKQVGQFGKNLITPGSQEIFYGYKTLGHIGNIHYSNGLRKGTSDSHGTASDKPLIPALPVTNFLRNLE